MMFYRPSTRKGFTLIELLVVIAIIGVLAAIVSFAIDQSRIRGRDGARKSQAQEILKALELTFTDLSLYPSAPLTGSDLTDVALTSQFIGTGPNSYLKRVPDEPERYRYCVSSDRKSMMLAVNTENDQGGSDYCSITRGAGSGPTGYGCSVWTAANASDSCAGRF